MYLEVIAFAALISTQIIIGCICYYVGFVNALELVDKLKTLKKSQEVK